MKRETRFEKLQKLVDLDQRIQRATREPIPDDVRMFVCQRDKGQCVNYGSKERLEFDHIIPVSKGGSHTQRNLEKLRNGTSPRRVEELRARDLGEIASVTGTIIYAWALMSNHAQN